MIILYYIGKGCYFADCSSKSTNYCYANSSKNEGIISLSEVSLGVCHELKQADNNADKLPNGKMSTKGLGRSSPDKNDWITLEDGCIVPSGNFGPNKAFFLKECYNKFLETKKIREFDFSR